MSSAVDRIRADVMATPIVLYMRGTPAFPLCGCSSAVVQILDHLAVRYRAIDINSDSSTRQGLCQFSNWPSVPQLYVKGHFIGGADIVQEMYAAGELKALLLGAGLLNN